MPLYKLHLKNKPHNKENQGATTGRSSECESIPFVFLILYSLVFAP